jgi:TnpA family transposase
VDRQHVNIQHILASLALKATRQSVIIAKLSSYPRKNRTKKALWELDLIENEQAATSSSPK